MPAILKHWVGESYWPWPNDHIGETQNRGPSVRVNPKSIPDLEPPYPVVFSHPKGTFTLNGMELEDLWLECVNEEHLHPDSPITDYIETGLPKLLFISMLEGLYKNDRKEYKRLVKKYGIKWHPAVTHYSYITNTQVVIGDDGVGLDLVEELKMTGHVVEPVKVMEVK